MDDGMIGEIRLFGGGWAPRGWLFCDGGQLPTSTYAGLYSVVGNQYGGSGGVFHLPNLAPLNETATGSRWGGDKVCELRYVICYEGAYPAAS